MPKRISVEQEQAMISAYLAGASLEAAAAQISCSRTACSAALKRNSLNTRSIGETRKIPKEHEDAILEAYLSGMSAKQAAALFGYTAKACFNTLRRRGISSRSVTGANGIPKEHEDTMITAYLAGADLRHAADLLGYNPTTCLNVLRRRGISVRSFSEVRHWRKVDHTFFDVIDTEAKAYWLGFLTADGGIKNNVISLNLSIVDKAHLGKFAAALQSDYPITLTKSGTLACIAITSSKLVTALKNLGVGERKSFSVKPCQYVPEELLPSYWRGMFDGDGSLSCCKRSSSIKLQWKAYLCGNLHMVTGFHEFMSQFVTSKATIRPQKTIFRISYQSKALAQTVVQVLYSDATVYLDRKYALAQRLLTESE